MARRDYECGDCSHHFIKQRSVKDRYVVRCPRCRSNENIKIIILSAPADHSIRSYFDRQLGVRVSGKQDRDRVAKALGLEQARNRDEVDQELSAARYSIERKERDEKPPEAFYKSYYEAEQKNGD